jgi:hypothetical protein
MVPADAFEEVGELAQIDMTGGVAVFDHDGERNPAPLARRSSGARGAVTRPRAQRETATGFPPAERLAVSIEIPSSFADGDMCMYRIVTVKD